MSSTKWKYLWQLLPQIKHDLSQLSCIYEAITVRIENFKSLPESINAMLACLFLSNLNVWPELLLGVCDVHLLGHHHQELLKVHRPVTILVDLIDHVRQLLFLGILAQGPHHRPQFLNVSLMCQVLKTFAANLCCNCAISILVKQTESFFKLGNLFFCQTLGHYRHCTINSWYKYLSVEQLYKTGKRWTNKLIFV